MKEKEKMNDEEKWKRRENERTGNMRDEKNKRGKN